MESELPPGTVFATERGRCGVCRPERGETEVMFITNPLNGEAEPFCLDCGHTHASVQFRAFGYVEVRLRCPPGTAAHG